MSVVTVTFTKPGSLSLTLNEHEAGAAYLSTLLSKRPAASFANKLPTSMGHWYILTFTFTSRSTALILLALVFIPVGAVAHSSWLG
jgi:hypothetical protein